ncbi:MAG: hypothetical protein KDB07_05600, partial [Planctomycetes bacterium]|nr:hypothetical protein [Planctomycetota bacterium]
MHEEHFESLKKIKLLCLDFDGVFTTGHTFLGEDGRRLYRFSIHDGMGLVLLHAAEIDVAVMTFSNNEVIAERMRRLKIPHLDMGAHDK